MKKICFYTMLLMLALTVGLTSCRDRYEEGGVSDGKYSAEITLSLAAGGNVGSRTALPDPGQNGEEARQHVSRVVLYIYEDGCCVGYEIVDWPEIVNNNAKGSGTVEKTHKLKFEKFNKDSEYTLLAVGLDDEYDESSKSFLNKNSVEAYGLFPEEVENSEGDLISPSIVYESPIEDANANLIEGLHRGYIQRSELFSGYFTGKCDDIKEKKITINLFRRVAGVKCFFSKIPRIINETYKVKYLVLRLCSKQNKSVSLLRKTDVDVPDSEYTDYNNDPIDSSDGYIIMKFDLSPNTPYASGGGGGSGGGDGEYTENPDSTKPETPTNGDFLDPVGAGVYVLPAKFGDESYTDPEDGFGEVSTIMMELWNVDGDVLLRRRIIEKKQTPGTSRSGTGIIESHRYRYPIRANHFYRIGSKDNPITIDGSTSDIEVEIDDMWDEYYGGSIGDKNDGIGIDHEWGDHPAGSLDKK